MDMYRASEISQLTPPHPAPSSAPSSRGSMQRTKGALSPIRPSGSSIHQSPAQRSNERRSGIGSRGISAQNIPTMARAGALSGLDAPTPMHQEDIEILTDDDVIRDLDFVSILTNRRLSYTQSHSICEPVATPGAVLTDVFRGLREQNAKIIKTLNLLIAAGKKNKAAIADLENKLGDITAATNTLITSTRSFKANAMSTDTSIKAIRSHMLLIQDQLKHISASVNNSVSGEKRGLVPHSYNIYGRVYGSSPNALERASTPIQTQTHADNNALTLSALTGDAKDPLPATATSTTVMTPVHQSTLPNDQPLSLPPSPSPQDQAGRCAVLVKNEAILNAQQESQHASPTIQTGVSMTNTPISNLLNCNNFKVIPLRKTNAATKDGATKRMPASLQSLGQGQSPQMSFEPNKMERVPLATPMESMEVREGHGYDTDVTQRLDMLEKNLRQVTKQLGLSWIN